MGIKHAVCQFTLYRDVTALIPVTQSDQAEYQTRFFYLSYNVFVKGNETQKGLISLDAAHTTRQQRDIKYNNF